MKYIIFSDIHGNIYALQAMLKQIKSINVDGFIFCGDIGGYYYEHQKIYEEFLKLKNLIAIRGNHDQLLIDNYNNKHELIKLSLRYGNTYLRKYTDNYMKYISSLPIYREIRILDKSICIMHGGIKDYLNERIYPDSIINWESYNRHDIYFFGHTHYRMFRENKGKYLINPGSLGQPRDGKAASYGIFDFQKMEYENFDVYYDKSKLYKQVYSAKENIEDYLIEVLER